MRRRLRPPPRPKATNNGQVGPKVSRKTRTRAARGARYNDVMWTTPSSGGRRSLTNSSKLYASASALASHVVNGHDIVKIKINVKPNVLNNPRHLKHEVIPSVFFFSSLAERAITAVPVTALPYEAFVTSSKMPRFHQAETHNKRTQNQQQPNKNPTTQHQPHPNRKPST